MRPTLSIGVLAAALVGTAPCQSEVAPQAKVPNEVTTAVAAAKKENQRVLLVFGNDGLEQKLASRTLRRLIQYEYEKVSLPLDVPFGQGRRPKDADGAWIAILAPEYEWLVTRAHTDLRTEAEIQAVLDAHKATPLDANEVLEAARATAAESERNLLVHLGAPW